MRNGGVDLRLDERKVSKDCSALGRRVTALRLPTVVSREREENELRDRTLRSAGGDAEICWEVVALRVVRHERKLIKAAQDPLVRQLVWRAAAEILPECVTLGTVVADECVISRARRIREGGSNLLHERVISHSANVT